MNFRKQMMSIFCREAFLFGSFLALTLVVYFGMYETLYAAEDVQFLVKLVDKITAVTDVLRGNLARAFGVAAIVITAITGMLTHTPWNKIMAIIVSFLLILLAPEIVDFIIPSTN